MKEQTKKEIIEEDLKAIKDIVILSDTKGGQELVKGLTKDIVATLDSLADNRATLSLQEFVSLASDIKSKLDVVRVITRAKGNETFLKEELTEALKQ